MRRYRSSCLPAFPSNRHLSFFFTRGTGNGQSSSPTNKNARFPVFGSTETLSFSRACAAKSVAGLLSCASPPLKTTVLPSEPKISSSAPTSNSPAALINASAARCGVSKVLAISLGPVFEETVGVTADCCATRAEQVHPSTHASWPIGSNSFRKLRASELKFMTVLLMRPCPISVCRSGYLRRPPPPPRDPPPRQPPKLEAPRLLEERALAPLYP